MQHPEYYKLVHIKYLKNNTLITTKAWLAWSETYGYIWTTINNEILLDQEIIKWW